MSNLPAWPEESANIKLFTPPEWKSSSVFCSLRYDGNNQLSIVSSESSQRVLEVINLNDCIGVQVEIVLKNANEKKYETNEPTSPEPVDTQGSAVLTLYCYPQQEPLTWMQRWGLATSSSSKHPQPRVARYHRFVVAPAEDLQAVSRVAAVLQHYVTGRPASPLRYLILVNPRSGPKRNARNIAETVVQPMLLQAGIESDMVVTTHAQHAMQIGETKVVGNDKTLDDYDAVILMGGDGTIHEFLNGVMRRDDAMATLAKLRLGAIGCGSANGFTKTITYASQEVVGPLQETFLICKGHVTATDISTYTTRKNTYTSFLTFAWGNIADIDIDSECIRCLGESRFDVWGAWCILRMRHYRGRFSYTNDPKPVLPSSLNDPVPESWTVMEDDFILFWASHVSHAATGSMNSPHSRLQDGVIRVFILRKPMSRFRATRVLLGLDTGKHIEVEGAEYVACTAYRLEPQGSYNDLDGEVIEDGPVQAQVIPGVLNVFAGPLAK
ncbi:sphingosine kinase [Fistulifera solaris]|uniref:Sphingosine kinase n=1 Tax=Fistulifera solaris TaxID=1519565 RepID=A0A1Z5KSZ0_FISSO|nr:sphingosine kinase [Fistulifera solaris]|eukprot:GAX29409.1 sphingosine kinase [Fistulifera solaris]